MDAKTRNRLILGAAFVLAAGAISYQMYHSMTPARHADHDHAMATLDAGGFLWIEALSGDRRNLVGRPDKVIILHWFDPSAGGSSEQVQAARYAAAVANDPLVEVLLIARAEERGVVESWAESSGVPVDLLYLDDGGRTAELIGVRRFPESLIYDPAGRLAFQARGPMSWSPGSLGQRVGVAKRGVEEID
jgi:hypothetical protein